MHVDNGKLDAELSGGTDDTAAAVNERAADKKPDLGGPPARPQPPVSLVHVGCCLLCHLTDMSQVTDMEIKLLHSQFNKF